MNKAIYLMAIGLIVTMVYSCTPQAITDEESNPQSCCGSDMHNPPPPSTGIIGD